MQVYPYEYAPCHCNDRWQKLQNSCEGPAAPAARKDGQAVEAFKQLESELEALSYDPSDSDLQTIEQLANAGMVTLEDIQVGKSNRQIT